MLTKLKRYNDSYAWTCDLGYPGAVYFFVLSSNPIYSEAPPIWTAVFGLS